MTTSSNYAARLRHWRRHLTTGWIDRRWRELREARTDGWWDMAPWIRRTLTTIALLLALAMAARLVEIAWKVTGWGAGLDALWSTIDQPVRSYLTHHAAGLPAEAATLYSLWQLFGIAAFLLSWSTAGIGPCLSWTAWGATTVVMVWQDTPHDGRLLAAAIAVLAWTAASAFALSGLTLRPSICHHVNVPAPQVHVTLLRTPEQQHPTHQPGPSLN